MSVNMCVRSTAILIFLSMLNRPIAESQNPRPDPSTVQHSASPPASGVQNLSVTPTIPAGPDAMPNRYIQLWNTGDLRLLDGMFAPHPWLHYPVIPSLAMPPSMVAGRIAAWHNCMPDFNSKILDTIVQGNKVVLRLVHTGTYTKRCYTDIPGPLPGTAPVKIRVNEILIFALDHGKISDIWEQVDELRARLQMGAKWCNTPEASAAPSLAPPSKP
jgi:hypothetical protein